MSDFAAPLVLAILAIFMSAIVKYMQGLIDDAKIEVRDNDRGTTQSEISPHNSKTTIIDNFLDDGNLLSKKLQDKNKWLECHEIEYQWWDGKSEPKNMWEELSKEIWSSRPEFHDAVGFEYWCNVVKEGQELPWHIDKDEDAMREFNKLVTPLFGAVYYGFNHDGQYDGGRLWLPYAERDEDPREFESLRKNELTEIDANFNRLVYFNASLWHRVSDVTSGVRYTFAVNALKTLPKRLASA